MRSDWLRRPNLAQPCPSQSVFINASSKHSPSQAEPQFLMPVIKIDNVPRSPCPHQISVILGSYRLNYTSLESPWQEETFCKSNFFNGRMAWKRYSLTLCFFAATLVILPVCCLYVYMYVCSFVCSLYLSLCLTCVFDFLTNWRTGELANWRTGENSRIVNSWIVKWTGEQGNSGMKAEVNARIDLMR